MKRRALFLILITASMAGCVSPPPEPMVEEHSPRLAIAQNSEGLTTMSWASDSSYFYTIYYQDVKREKWEELGSMTRVRGTGGIMRARDSVDPRRGIVRRYRLHFEKPGDIRSF